MSINGKAARDLPVREARRMSPVAAHEAALRWALVYVRSAIERREAAGGLSEPDRAVVARERQRLEHAEGLLTESGAALGSVQGAGRG